MIKNITSTKLRTIMFIVFMTNRSRFKEIQMLQCCMKTTPMLLMRFIDAINIPRRRVILSVHLKKLLMSG